VEAAYRTVQARATISTALAVLVAILLSLALRAHPAMRMAAVAAMALSGLVLMVCVLDVFPGPARAVGLVALALYPVAAGLLFMPGVGVYRRSLTLPDRQIGAPLSG